MLLRFVGRLVSIPVLLIALVFLVALAINLGQEGNLPALPSAVPSAAGFTADYLQGLARGDLGVIASGHRSIANTPVTAELGRALPKSLGLMAFALTLAALVGLVLGIGAAFRRDSRLSKSATTPAWTRKAAENASWRPLPTPGGPHRME